MMSIDVRFTLAVLSAVFLLDVAYGQANDTHCVTGTAKCGWEQWGVWSACSRSCGQGTRSRQRGLCCELRQSFDECRAECNIPDESYEEDACNHVCPAGRGARTRLRLCPLCFIMLLRNIDA